MAIFEQKESLLLTVEEAGRLLGMGRSTTYGLCQKKEIPTIKIGRSVRIPRKGLEEWINKQTKGGEG